MKKIIYILLILIILSCSSNKNIEKENISLNPWSKIENKTDEQNLKEIKDLLNDAPLSTEPHTETGKINNTESWILNEKDLKIIENTNSWEIDELIDILFQDLN
jgi:hypothetical protein